MDHDLKIHPQHFARVLNNEIPFQIRFNDRNFQDGDTFTLHEFVPHDLGKGGEYTGSTIKGRINRVFHDLPGLMPGYVAFTTLPAVRE